MKPTNVQGVREILCFFSRIFKNLPPVPRKHWAAIGRTDNNQPKTLTLRREL